MKPPMVMVKKKDARAEKEVRLLMGVNYTNIVDSVSVVTNGTYTAFLFLIKDTTETAALFKAAFHFVSFSSPNSLTLPMYRETFIISSKPSIHGS